MDVGGQHAGRADGQRFEGTGSRHPASGRHTVFYFGAERRRRWPHVHLQHHHQLLDGGPDYPGTDNAADAPPHCCPTAAHPDAGEFRRVRLAEPLAREVDYTNNTFTQVSSPPSNNFPYVGHMLVLPTGQVLQTEQSNDIRLHTSTGTYQGRMAARHLDGAVDHPPGSSYVISGTQFNGLSQGAAYGDDWQSATNHPIVRITNVATGHVMFKTHDHSSMGVATGSLVVSTTFDVPASIETGASTIEVIANGIPSAKTKLRAERGGTRTVQQDGTANGATGQGLSVNLSGARVQARGQLRLTASDTVNNGACDTSWVSAGCATSATLNGS